MPESKAERRARRALILTNHLTERPEWIRGLAEEADVVIAADGGFSAARLASVVPHILIGDMDSVDSSQLAQFRAGGGETLTYPAEKDQTDTHLAVELALQKGFRHITIASSVSGRLDHIMANLMLLDFISRAGASGRVESENTSVRLLCDGEELEIERGRGDTVSLIPLSPDVTGVELSGFRYPLAGTRLLRGDTLGISNVVLDDPATIRIGEGRLLVIRTRC